MMGVFGENLAYQTGPAGPSGDLARNCFQGWEDSPGHRANLLRTDYTHVGHGVVRLKDTWYSAAVFGGLAATRTGPSPCRCASTGLEINAALIAARPALPAYFVSDPEARADRRRLSDAPVLAFALAAERF